MGRGRLKLKYRKKRSTFSKIMILVISVVLASFLLLTFLGKRFKPELEEYAELETRKFAKLVVDNSLAKQVEDGMDTERLFTVVQNEAGEVQTVDFNSVVVNQILSKTTTLIQHNFKAIEAGKLDEVDLPGKSFVDYDQKDLGKGVIFQIPVLSVTSNPFFANLGPKVPLKFKLIDDVIGSFKSKVKEYGINNAMIEVYVHVEVRVSAVLPITSKEIVVQNDIPLGVKVIQGKIPNYYQNGTGNSSSFSVPLS